MSGDKKGIREMAGETLAAVNGAFNSLNSQAQALIRGMMSQGKISNEDGRKIVDGIAEKLRQHREQVETMLITSVDAAVAKFNSSTRGQLDELSRRLAGVAREIEKISGLNRRKKG
jgi:polyhydroxyalkanoate synthesis regulator phasin